MEKQKMKHGKSSSADFVLVALVGACLLAAVVAVAGCRGCNGFTEGGNPNPIVLSKTYSWEFQCPERNEPIRMEGVPDGVTEIKCRVCGKTHHLEATQANFFYKSSYMYDAELDTPAGFEPQN